MKLLECTSYSFHYHGGEGIIQNNYFKLQYILSNISYYKILLHIIQVQTLHTQPYQIKKNKWAESRKE